MTDVFISYLWASIAVVSNILLSWFVAKTINQKWNNFVTEKTKFFLVIIGSALLLIAGVAELGWGSSIITLEGQSTPEKFNNCLFWIFSMSGGFLIFLELFLARFKNI